VIKAEGELSSAVARLLAVSEAYPELKANQDFLALQEELTSTKTASLSPASFTTTTSPN